MIENLPVAQVAAAPSETLPVPIPPSGKATWEASALKVRILTL